MPPTKVKDLIIEPIEKKSKIVQDKQYTWTDPEWTDYVLSQLHEEEMWDGVPKMDGLRRLVEKLISPIRSISVNIQTVLTNNLVVIAIAEVILDNDTKMTAVSDATYYSAAPGFGHKLAALADSRAKSKAFRELLRLRNVSTIDEVNTANTVDLEDQEPILGTQIALINKLLKEIQDKINLNKVILHVCEGVALEEVASNSTLIACPLDRLKHTQAGKLIQKLSNFKAKREQVPKELCND